ncbi:MAG: putative alpha/beta hydrolase family esterase [Candidatus Azotimanducaceae bacterium]|jgi:predicted alpha/beta hydrolase family esterase
MSDNTQTADNSNGVKNAFIIHGAYGNPDENWIPWLRTELESSGYNVFAPQFPTPEGQSYDSWMNVIELHLSEFNKKTVLIGHSIGATFALSILEKLDVQIAKTALVAGFVGSFEGKYANQMFDSINKTIAEREFDWEKIKNNSKEFYILYGNNDPYVPPEKPHELGKHLQVEPIVIPGGGHLNEDADFLKFPELLQVIEK